jgi:hypothetical protein
MGQVQNPMNHVLKDTLPHEIKGLVDYDLSFFWLIIIAVIVAICIFIYLFLQKKKIKKNKTKLSKQELFRLLINEIIAIKPIAPFVYEKQRQFYFDLDFKFRQVIELSEDVRATDLTINELKRALTKLNFFNSLVVVEMLKFFDISQKVKFAKKPSSESEALQMKNNILVWTKKINFPEESRGNNKKRYNSKA